MAQGRQQNNGSRQRCAQSAAAKAPAEPPKAVCAQLEQMNRKLAAASAEILRYQTRLFACERQMAALRQENAQLEAACEQARQEAECASAHAEQLRQELARHAEAAGADGIGVVTPYYFSLTEEELFQHYCCVASSVSSDFPVYLYAIPQMAVNDISVSLAERIAEACPNIVGIKYSFPDMPKMLRFQTIRGGDFSVLTGPDDLFYALLASGGDGTISGNSNVIPQEYVSVYSAFQRGDYQEAARRQARVNQLNAILSGICNLASYKACLVKRGVIRSKNLRAPLRPLSSEQEAELFVRLEQLGEDSILAPVQI